MLKAGNELWSLYSYQLPFSKIVPEIDSELDTQLNLKLVKIWKLGATVFIHSVTDILFGTY